MSSYGVEVERNDYASKGVANGGLVTGIIGTAGFGLTAMTALLSALSKQNRPQLHVQSSGGSDAMLAAVLAAAAASSGGSKSCNEDHTVNRYEAGQSARIAELETEIKLRDANTYTDQKLLEVYKHFDNKISGVEAQLCQQSVYNATNTAALNCMQGQIAQLLSMTKMVIPNSSVCPGWGTATVSVSTGTTTA